MMKCYLSVRIAVIAALGAAIASCGTAMAAEILITSNAVWKYLDNGTDQGTAWRANPFNDAAWAKYKLGEFLEINDPTTGKPATANPWRTAPVVLGHERDPCTTRLAMWDLESASRALGYEPWHEPTGPGRVAT